MSMNRREFLKIAGVSTIAGIGGMALFDKIQKNTLEAAGFVSNPDALTAKRWAMVIDVSKFKTEDDYKKCIEVCHRTHNVPDIGNPKQEIKWLWTDNFEHTFPGQSHEYLVEDIKHKNFLLLCNQCANPACVRVCPTKATFKRKDGIVMQDMHRCIGCRFCMAACPFGARSFNFRNPRDFIKAENENKEYPTRMIGVVEKCTFCTERLAVGKIPACVEVAPKDGLVFGDLDDPNSYVRKVLSKNYTIRRKPELGTEPSVFYVVGSSESAAVPGL